MPKLYTLYRITHLYQGTVKGLQTLFVGRLQECYDHADAQDYRNDTRVILSKRSWEEIIDKPWFAITGPKLKRS